MRVPDCRFSSELPLDRGQGEGFPVDSCSLMSQALRRSSRHSNRQTMDSGHARPTAGRHSTLLRAIRLPKLRLN